MTQLFIFNENGRASSYGIGTYIKQLYNCIKENYVTNIINLYSNSLEFKVRTEDNNRIIDIPCNQYKYIEGECDEHYFINCLYLLNNFIDNKYDIIFHFNHFRYENTLIKLKEKYPKCKIVLTVHYLNWCFLLNGNTKYFKKIINNTLKENLNELEKKVLATYHDEKAFIKEVDQVICLAQYTRKLLYTTYNVPKNKITTIYNGLEDEAYFLTQNEKYKIKENMNFKKNDKIILYVGRLDDIKGIEYIIYSFQILISKIDNCYLIIIGDGDYNKYLNICKYHWNKIFFTGKLDKSEIYKFYQIADIGIMLSKHEQCSYVAIEMMMHSIPIIASNTTGLNEMITDNYNGLKLNTRFKKSEYDIYRCSNILFNTLTSNKLMNMQCRQRYIERYSLNLMKNKMNILYKKL